MTNGLRLHVLLPDILDHPTGGNRYNTRIIEAIRPFASVTTGVLSADEPFPGEDSALNRADVVLLDTLLLTHPALASIRAGYRGKLVLMLHYLAMLDPSVHDPARADRERGVLALFDGFVCTGRHVKERLVEAGLRPVGIAVVAPGLDAVHQAPPGNRVPSSSLRILTVANWLPGKGLLEFIGCLERLIDLRWTWTLIGDDALDSGYAGRFREGLKRSPIAPRVRVWGALPAEAVVQQYRSGDLFVLPSRYETCSMVTMEALAAGLPVVAYRVGGLPEHITRSEEGVLVTPGQPDEMAGALRRLLLEPDRRTALSHAARRRAEQYTTWQEAGRGLLDFLTSLAREDFR